MKQVKGKRFHYEGKDAHGSCVFSECVKGEDEPVVVKAERAVSGQTPPYGASLVHIKSVDDEHVEIEDACDTSGKGPAMVSSKEFRSGWERTFGSNGVN